MRGSLVGLLIGVNALLGATQEGTVPRAYRAIVEAYRHDSQPALDLLAAMPAADRERDVGTASRPDSGWTADELEAAIVMHTDAAIPLIASDEQRAMASLNDALLLANAAGRDDETHWFIARWYEGVTAALAHDHQLPAHLRSLQQHMRQQAWFAAVGPLLQGCWFELVGNERPDSGWEHHLTDVTVYQPSQFRLAVPHFEEAMRAGPALRIAAVHLGRIRMLTGDDGRARQLFERAAAAHDRQTRYFADLFLGALEERADHVEAAETRYRAALQTFPGAQSARLALAAFLARHNRGLDAAAVLAPPLSADSARRFNPWWTYFPPSVAPTLPSIIEQLRAEVVQ